MRIKLTIRNFTAIILTAIMLLLSLPAFADTESENAKSANSRDTADYEYYDEPEEIGTITENGNVSSGHIGGDMAETQGNQYTESDGFNGWCYTSVNVIAGSSEYMFEGNDGITWVSEDPDQTIATIGSMDAGMYYVVYGNKPGKAVFLISKTVNGVKQTVRCTVTVRLASGVYYFNSKYKNSSGNSYRLDLRGGWIDNNNPIQIWESGTGEPTNRNQLFKIKYIGSGKYSIRSMVKNSMGMTNYAGIVANSSVGYTHDGVPEASRWCIEPIPDSNGNPSGYRIYSTYSGGEKTITLSGTTNGTPAALSNSFSQSNSMQVWDITKAKTRYNGVTIGRSNNINIYKTYIGDGDSYIYTPAAYSSSENNNGSGTYHGLLQTAQEEHM